MIPKKLNSKKKRKKRTERNPENSVFRMLLKKLDSLQPFVENLKKNPSGKTRIALNDWNGKELKEFSLEAENKDIIKLAEKYFYLKKLSDELKSAGKFFK